MREKNIPSIVANSIRAYRKQRGLTIEKLAEMAAIDPGHVSNLEAKKRSPSLMMLARLSAALGVSPSDLLVDPASAANDSLDRRFHAQFKSLGHSEKVDLLAILASPKLELKALRRLLHA